jgi:hypothetical protein
MQLLYTWQNVHLNDMRQREMRQHAQETRLVQELQQSDVIQASRPAELREQETVEQHIVLAVTPA